jgi:hypothetical protein
MITCYKDVFVKLATLGPVTVDELYDGSFTMSLLQRTLRRGTKNHVFSCQGDVYCINWVHVNEAATTSAKTQWIAHCARCIVNGVTTRLHNHPTPLSAPL